MLTRRLVLRPVTAADAEDVWLVHQDPHIARWYAGAWSPEQARRWAQEAEEAWRRDGVGKWLAHRREDGELVGRGGLSRTVLQERPCLELGWAVRTPFRGAGYATEIGRAGVRFAFEVLGAQEVLSFTEEHNTASRAVMERVGMRHVGRVVRPGLVEGLDGVQESAPFALYRIERDAPGG
ncbi:GNAT family N-acetyltransferase [Kineococcus glutinatus]|uniref:GNAT family N-acetyltransferase n=1 Tax=Kineococcus glutinatus TaxID=1070872 RepID=A0ABP9HGT3_9ACTN